MPLLEELRQLLAREPNDPFLLYALAQEHARRGEHDLAVEFYDRCLTVDPHYCYAYFHKARSLQSLEQHAQACQVLEAGIAAAREAGDAQARDEMSEYLRQIGRSAPF